MGPKGPAHLGLHQPVDDGLQRLGAVAGQHALKVLRAVLQGLGHRHVQVVVVLLRCQVLGGTTDLQGGGRLRSD